MKKFLVSVFLLLCCCFCVFAYSLADLQLKCASSNLAVLSAREDYEQALLDVKDARAGYGPAVDLTVTGTYLVNPIEAIRISTGDLISAIGITDNLTAASEYLTVYGGQEKSMYQFSLQITQPLYTWGKLSDAVKIYENVASVRLLQIDSLNEQNSAELKSRLAALYYLNSMVSLLSQEKELADELVTICESGVENSVVLPSALSEARVSASQVDVAISRVNREIQVQLQAVCSLCNLDSLTMDEIDFTPDEGLYLSILSRSLDSLKALALSGESTSLKMLSILQTVSELAADVAQASVNWKPNLAFVAQLSYSGSRLPLIETDWYRKDSLNTTLTLALQTSIYDGGQAIRNVGRTASEAVSSAIDIALARQTISSTLSENYSQIALCAAQLSYYDALSGSLSEKLSALESRYAAGTASKAEVLQAEVEFVAVQIEKIEVLVTLSSSYYIIECLI